MALNTLHSVRSLDSRIETLTPTVNTDFTLPSTGILAGQRVIMLNNGANSGNFPIVSLKASNGTLVRQVYPQCDGTVVALQDTPTDVAHWAGVGEITSNWMTFTPTGGLSTNIAYTGAWRRKGPNAEFWFKGTFSGTNTQGAMFFNMTSAVGVVDTANLPGGDLRTAPCGGWTYDDASSVSYGGPMSYSTSGIGRFYTLVHMSNTTSPTSLNTLDTSANRPTTVAASDAINALVSVPIVGWTTTKG